MTGQGEKRCRVVSDEVRAEIIDMAKAGVGRNEIARRVGYSTGTVSNVVAAVPEVSFERTVNDVARQALVADVQERQLHICADLLAFVEETIDDLRSPFAIRNWHQGKMATRTVDRPPVSAKREMMVSIGIALDKIDGLRPPGTGSTKGALSRFMDILEESLKQPEPPQPKPGKRAPAKKEPAAPKTPAKKKPAAKKKP